MAYNNVPTFGQQRSALQGLTSGGTGSGSAAAGFLASTAGKSLGIGTALQAGGALASGIGNISAARAMRLTEDELRELEELQRARQAGQLGLTEAQEGRLEQQFATRRGGLLRQQQATALQQAAQAGPVSGRDVFLRQQAAQAGQAEMLRSENELRAQAEAAAEATQTARLKELRQQDKAAKAAMRQAIGSTVAGVLGVPAQPLQQYSLLSATGKISPYAFQSEQETLDAALSSPGVPKEEQVFVEGFE